MAELPVRTYKDAKLPHYNPDPRSEQRRAISRLVASNLKLVVKQVMARLHVWDYDSLMQEAALALQLAIERFDPSTGNKLSSYVYLWVRKGLNQALTTKTRTIRHTYSEVKRQVRGEELQWESRKCISLDSDAYFDEVDGDQLSDCVTEENLVWADGVGYGWKGSGRVPGVKVKGKGKAKRGVQNVAGGG